MTSIADLISSIKSDLVSRYKSPILGALVVAIVFTHWKVAIYLLVEKHSAVDAIAFIEANTSKASLFWATLAAVIYVVAFSWLEHAIDRLASHGRRRRNEFQSREREREVGRKKLIAQELAQTLELEMRNSNKESVLSDTELARSYQGILSGENFSRWLVDLAAGPINSSLNNTIVNYLHKVDSTEGRFNDPEIEQAHAAFVSEISTLHSALNDSRNSTDDKKREEVVKFSQQAQTSQKRYRQIVRQKLRI